MEIRYGDTLAVAGEPDLAALRPRFTAPARVLLRFADGTGGQRDADSAITPVCGHVVPAPLDRTLEFFDADGLGYGRLRPDSERGTAWESDPGRSAVLDAQPSTALPNRFLGAIAEGLLAADTAAAVVSAAGQRMRGSPR